MAIVKDIIKKDILNGANNLSAVFLYRKLEKITIAIYMITDFFPEEEPLKNYLRTKCIELMSYIISLAKGPSCLDEEAFFKVVSLMSEIDSSLRISLSIGLISEMNYSILGEEYKSFLEVVKQKKEEGLGRKIIFPENFFDEEDKDAFKNAVNKKEEHKEITRGSKGHYKGQEKQDKTEEKVIKDISQISSKKTSEKSVNTKESVKSGGSVTRQEMMLILIKEKKEVSVKDIAKKVKGISEKTIQRELLSMVNKNILKKQGERRWSRYSLKK